MTRTRRGAASGFPPVVGPTARILVLGSMPGVKSLTAGRYYAHERNAFWKIMSGILRFPADAPYDQRLEALTAAGIALWDVVHSCVREGSLDADIEAGSIKVNDFEYFFRQHPEIEKIFFNGATAERLYRQRVLSSTGVRAIPLMRLPSTSPAHASLSLEEKIAIWHAAISGSLEGS